MDGEKCGNFNLNTANALETALRLLLDFDFAETQSKALMTVLIRLLGQSYGLICRGGDIYDAISLNFFFKF